MKVLVMGGTSFVSKCFAIYAIKKGYKVDIFTRGKNEVDYEGINKHLIGDRKDAGDVKKLVKDAYDYVVDINAYTEDDVKILSDVLDTSRLKRYVLCSTASVYMMPEEGKTIDEEYPKGYDEIFGGDYGFNKYKAENYLLDSEIPVTIFRPTYIYGEYNDVFRDAFLFESINRGRVNTPEDTCRVQFVYVQDMVKSFESCFHSQASVNQAYNISNPEILKWSDWIKAGFQAVGKEAEICTFTEEEIKESEDIVFPFGKSDLVFNTEKLKRHGLYVPETKIKDGLSNAYKWYKKFGESAVTKRKFELV